MIAKFGIDEIMLYAKKESREIYESLQELDHRQRYVRNQLSSVSSMFSIDINYEKEWTKFLGIDFGVI